MIGFWAVITCDQASLDQSEKSPDSGLATDSQVILLHLPTEMRFLIGGERVTCRGLNLSNSLGRIKLTNSFGLARDHVVHLETAGNLCTGRPDVKSH